MRSYLTHAAHVAGALALLRWLSSAVCVSRGRSNYAATRSQLTALRAALANYRADRGAYPRGPSPAGEGAPWLYQALCDPRQPRLDPRAAPTLGCTEPALVGSA